MKLFLDANVLFTAAHNPRGKAALLFELAAQGYWTLHSSSYAVEEARRNLERKFPESLDQFERISTALSLTEHHPDYRFPSGLARKDQPIFQAAMACQANYLLTGDLKDFGSFVNAKERTFGVCVLTVADFLAATRI
ncbi:MAG: PIN domain-containing protein [Sedimenticolaceae bacterium]